MLNANCLVRPANCPANRKKVIGFSERHLWALIHRDGGAKGEYYRVFKHGYESVYSMESNPYKGIKSHIFHMGHLAGSRDRRAEEWAHDNW